MPKTPVLFQTPFKAYLRAYKEWCKSQPLGPELIVKGRVNSEDSKVVFYVTMAGCIRVKYGPPDAVYGDPKSAFVRTSDEISKKSMKDVLTGESNMTISTSQGHDTIDFDPKNQGKIIGWFSWLTTKA
jgi:hypothetical protein